MKNNWLKRKEKRSLDRKTLGDIDKIVKKYHETGEGFDKIQTILNVLATQVIDYLSHRLTFEERVEVHKEMVRSCTERLRRLDTDKGHAFNYFTTVMLAILRQLTVTPTDMKKLKEQYREYIASRNCRNRDQRQA